MGRAAGDLEVPARNIRVLRGAILVTTLGNGMFAAIATLYFVRVVGISSAGLAAGLAIASAFAIVGGLPGGYLSDLWGARRVTVSMTILAGIVMCGYPFIGNSWQFAFAASIFALLDRAGYTARQTLIVRGVGASDIVRVKAQLRSLTNVGITVGAGVGGIALVVDDPDLYRTLFVVDGTTFVIAGLSFALMTEEFRQRVDSGQKRLARFVVLRDRRFIGITVANMAMLLYVPVFDVALPYWIQSDTHAPGFIIAVLIAVNTLSVVLFQVSISERVDSMSRGRAAIRLSAVALAGGSLLFSMTGGMASSLATAILVAGAGLMVLGEMLQSAAGWLVSYSLAPDDSMGQYQGVFNTGTAVAQSLGPSILLLVLSWAGGGGWMAIAAVFVVSGTTFAMILPREPLREPVLAK